MKLRKKSITAICLALAILLLMTGCAGDKNPYRNNDSQNYNVSVRFDANGGLFDTNMSVITDSYNISDLQSNAAGEVELPLLDPNDQLRGSIDSFQATRSGYFLAGWYAERTQVGENEYTYSKKWDFAKDRLKVASGGSYSSEEPVLTLYAAWIPSFTIEYYDYQTGELLDTANYNPIESNGIEVPKWSESTGKLSMKNFPKRKGFTFANVYLSQTDTEPVSAEVIEHCGIVNLENGTGSNGTMKLYVEWVEGEWFHAYTAQQFIKLIEDDANFEICADLDFEGLKWPKDLFNGEYSGIINGNGFTFNHVDASAKPLFKELGEGAQIKDLTFDIVNPSEGSGLGLLCGEVSDQSVLDQVQIVVDGATVYPVEISE